MKLEIPYHLLISKAWLLLLALNMVIPTINAQNPLKKRISLSVHEKSLEEIIHLLQNKEGVAFSYSKNIIKLDKKVTADFTEIELDQLLDQLFTDANIRYILKAGMIVLQPKPQNIDKVIVSGTIRDMENGKPLEFAGVQLKKSGKGGITDNNGNFSFQIKRSELHDSLEVSTLGYEKACYVASGFTESSEHVVYLKLKLENLQTVNISASDFKVKSIGNHSLFSFGSIYIDTQGQQTALLIRNKKRKKGIISSVSFFLSDKGNFLSPFRVRIYEIDTVTGKPGKDLLKEMLVAKPKSDGWYKMPISQFNIVVPQEGFFVAIEGIYPNEYMRKDAEIIEGSDSEFPNTISYGQRLGFSKKKGEDTWHYSLAHTWFQLKEDNYHVMISADFQHHKY